jgi:ribonuclease VapC
VSRAVLDASALLAFLQDEPGAEQVELALEDGAFVSSVNLAEVVTKLVDAGLDDGEVRLRLNVAGLTVSLFDLDDSYITGLLRRTTRTAGFSLGDRACISLALRLQLPVLTTDNAWQSVSTGATIVLIREPR